MTLSLELSSVGEQPIGFTEAAVQMREVATKRRSKESNEDRVGFSDSSESMVIGISGPILSKL